MLALNRLAHFDDLFGCTIRPGRQDPKSFRCTHSYSWIGRAQVFHEPAGPNPVFFQIVLYRLHVILLNMF